VSRVFISYRRDDSRGSAGRLYDELCDQLGADVVFRDLDDIEPGEQYDQVIDAAVDACDALIAVIGTGWLEARDAGGGRRLEQPHDLVRLEIASALAHGKAVIPVLVDDAEMPAASALPPPLAPLATRNALELSDDRWAYDVRRLVDRLEALLEPARPPARHRPARDGSHRPSPTRATLRIGALVAVVVLAAIVGRTALGGDGSGDGADVSATAAAGDPDRPGDASPAGVGSPEGDAGVVPIAVGDAVGPTEITAPGERHVYTFPGAAGEIVYLEAQYEGPCCELRWALLSPSGATVATTYLDTDLGRLPLSATGDHTIEVWSEGGGTGAYGFVLTPTR
jgi:hypothetical protein